MTITSTYSTLRPLNINSDQDMVTIAALYASTRQEEMSLSGWPQQQIDQFLQSQFEAQHTFYMEQFPNASFDLIEIEGQVAGRLYVNRTAERVTIIDIALFPEFRNQKIGEHYLTALQQEITDPKQRLTIHVEHVNPALTLYIRLGFYPIQLQGLYILMEWVNSAELRAERKAQYEPLVKAELQEMTGTAHA